MKKVLKSLSFVILIAALSGCNSLSSREDKELDKKIAEERPAQSPDDIARRGAMSFITAPGLTQDQRQKLMEVYTRTYLGAEAIRGEIGQSKSLLFKMIAKNSYKSREMEQLRNKVVALDQKRLQLMFQALEDTQSIVGYGGDTEQFYRHFESHEYPEGFGHR